MSAVERLNSLQRCVLMVVLIYVVNLSVIVLNYGGIAETLAHTFGWQGPYRQWVSMAVVLSTMGFFVGEVGCLALWANTSTVRIDTKVLVYFLVTLHALFIALWAMGNSFDLRMLLMSLGVAVGFLVLTNLALRLSTGRYRLLPVSQASEGLSHGGVTIAQIVYGTTVLAIGLGVLSAGMLSGPTTLGVVMALIFIVCSVGLLPTSGLLIATSLRSLPIQFLVCVIASGSIASILTSSIRPPGQPGPPGAIGFALLSIAFVLMWLVFLPVVWVRILKAFGYVIRFYERNPKPRVENPLKEDGTEWNIE